MASTTSTQQDAITELFGSAVLIDLTNPQSKAATTVTWAVVDRAMDVLVARFADRGITKGFDDAVIQANWWLVLPSMARDAEVQAALGNLLNGYERAASAGPSTTAVAEGSDDDRRKLSYDQIDSVLDIRRSRQFTLGSDL